MSTYAPELFFYSGRAFAGGQVTLTPGYSVSDRHASLIVDRRVREDVPLVIMDTDTQAEMAIHYPRVVRHVTSRYREVGRFPLADNKAFIVLRGDGPCAVTECWSAADPVLVPWKRGASHGSRAGHPGSRRCSSLEYAQSAPASRLAIRAPRSGTSATHHASRGRDALTVAAAPTYCFS